MFTPENELERSLMRASMDPAQRPQFYKDLAGSDVFVITPGTMPSPGGPATLAPGTQLKLSQIEFAGTQHIAFFSSLTRLQAVLQTEVGYLQMNALELFKIVKDLPLVLNPGSKYGKEFTSTEVAEIVSSTLGQPQVLKTERAAQVLLGQPKDYPQELADALTRLFQGLPQVQSGYLAQIHDASQPQPPHTLIGIAVKGDWDTVIAQAGIVARGVNIPNPPLDIVQIGSGGGLDSYLQTTKPFYKRPRLGGIFGGRQ